MSVDVVVLNGGSSSGKTTIGRCLQDLLPETWLMLGVDDLIAAMPSRRDDSLIAFAADGTVAVGAGFRKLESAWYDGIAAMARSGARVIIAEVFLGGASSQSRLGQALVGLEVVWVGVRCDAGVAAAREATRPDRVPGMAAAQFEIVHQGVDYDMEVDTTTIPGRACAEHIKARLLSGHHEESM